MVPRILSRSAANFETVAKALGHQQPDPGAGVLENGVGSDGRAVNQQIAIGDDLTERDRHRAGGLLDGGKHALCRVVGL